MQNKIIIINLRYWLGLKQKNCNFEVIMEYNRRHKKKLFQQFFEGIGMQGLKFAGY